MPAPPKLSHVFGKKGQIEIFCQTNAENAADTAHDVDTAEKSVYNCKVKITAPSATVHPAYAVKLPNIADV